MVASLLDDTYGANNQCLSGERFRVTVSRSKRGGLSMVAAAEVPLMVLRVEVGTRGQRTLPVAQLHD